MSVIDVAGVTHRYWRVTALQEVTLSVPEGSVYALLGPNGAGKTTLLQIVMGLRRPTTGRVRLFGRETPGARVTDRQLIGYVAEGQRLPGGMTLHELERFLAPLYPRWDDRLATELRERFRLDGGRRLRTLSKGERMKAALLCALAPRPKLLVMDEPFSGMDVVVRDELVGGLLGTAGEEGWTVLVTSHDLTELETLADHVGFLDGGRLRLSESADVLRERFIRVELVGAGAAPPVPPGLPGIVRSASSAGPRTTFVLELSAPTPEEELRRRLQNGARVSTRPASLREVFVALAGEPQAAEAKEVAA